MNKKLVNINNLKSKEQKIKLSFFNNVNRVKNSFQKFKPYRYAKELVAIFAKYFADYFEKLDEKRLDIFLCFLPIIFGISQILYYRYGNQSFWFFTNKTLPTLSIPYETISYDTFHQIMQKDFAKNFYKQVKQIDFFSDFILIEKTDVQDLKERQYFIGNFNKKNFCTDSTDFSIYSQNYSIPARYFCNDLQFFYYDLDQLPLKMSSVYNPSVDFKTNLLDLPNKEEDYSSKNEIFTQNSSLNSFQSQKIRLPSYFFKK